MTELEKSIEKTLTEKVRVHGGLCLKWVCPGWAGVPDRIVLLPPGRVVFVELKRPKNGKLSALQKWWRDWLQWHGFVYYVIQDRSKLQWFVERELEGKE